MPDLEFLSRYATSRIESGMNLLKLRPRSAGIVHPPLPHRVPARGRLVGYAVTCVMSTSESQSFGHREGFDYWTYVQHVAGPKVAVILDADPRPGFGAMLGRVGAGIHHALGCRGVLTNGGVRDLDAVEALGLQVFCGTPTAGHGSPHIVAFNTPVVLGGAAIRPGDVVCADEHGAIVVPPEALPNLEEAIAQDELRVGPVLDYCRRPGFTPAGLADVMAQHMKNPPAWEPRRKP